MALPLVFVEPAQADTCVLGAVCIPNIPQLPIPVPNVPPITITVPPVITQTPTPTPPVTPPVPPKTVPAPVTPTTPGKVQSAPQTQVNTPNTPSTPATPPAAPTTPPVTTSCKPTTQQLPGKDTVKTKTRYVTVAQAVSFSIVAFALGGILVLLAMYVLYRIGRREGEASVNEFMSDLLALTVRHDSEEKES